MSSFRWVVRIVNGALSIFLCILVIVLVYHGPAAEFPAIRCNGSNVHEPELSHKSRGDTITTKTLLSIVFIATLVEFSIIEWIRLMSRKTLQYTSPDRPAKWRVTLTNIADVYKDYVLGCLFLILFVEVAKATFRAPRPHWVDICKPHFPKDSCQSGWVDEYNCTNPEISSYRLKDGYKSFPSGHAGLGFFSGTFMIMQNVSRKLGSPVVLWLHGIWLMWAIFCASSRVSDYRHHFRDVICGSIIGCLFAIFTALYVNSRGSLGMLKAILCRENSKHGEIDTELPTHPPNDFVGVSIGKNGMIKKKGRPSLKRLLSSQSSQMNGVTEDRESDAL